MIGAYGGAIPPSHDSAAREARVRSKQNLLQVLMERVLDKGSFTRQRVLKVSSTCSALRTIAQPLWDQHEGMCGGVVILWEFYLI